MRKGKLVRKGCFWLLFAIAGGEGVPARVEKGEIGWEACSVLRAGGPVVLPEEGVAGATSGREVGLFAGPALIAGLRSMPAASAPGDSVWGELDTYLSGLGLIDVSTLDASFRIRLMYAAADNFLHEAVYQGITRAWLRPEAARMLAEASRLLKEEHPGWTLIVYDAARPLSVQRRMWQQVRGTAYTNYVSNPANGGGLHNYGMAVDVSIADETGTPLPMGTAVDYFGPEAHTTREEDLVKDGRITRQAYANRQLLRRLMRQAGFRTIPYEWWHFNACSRAFARAHYPVIE